MEITLKINGKDKVFKQNKTTFYTIQKALDYQEAMLEQLDLLKELSNQEIDTEIDYSKFETDPREDVERSANLIVAYFDEQFTYDDFLKGAYFDNAQELHAMANEVMFEILDTKAEETDSKKVSRQQKK